MFLASRKHLETSDLIKERLELLPRFCLDMTFIGAGAGENRGGDSSIIEL